ncbi:ABC transporter permease [Sungkyunkwania multivorans]|uniref:ABC transporter permease n=1 Tax=Sungkyunkwania multivorans TaxID=1173618 RepID=A0ABW3D2J1_9FLAO
MRLKVPLYIAKRYLISKSSQNAINIINIVAFTVVVIATASLFVVLAGFSGLKTFGLSFSNSFDADLKVFPVTGKSFFVSADQIEQLKETAGIINFSEVVEERVFLHFKQKNAIPILKGVDENYKNVVAIDSALGYGNWVSKNSQDVILGANVATTLGAGILDYGNLIEVIVPKAGKGNITSGQKPYNNTLVAAVDYYMVSEDLDAKYAFCDIDLARSLLNFAPNQISAIEIRMSEDIDEIALRREISSIFEDDVLIKNRAELNDALYKMLNTENIAIYLIFTLVLIIALFNVIGSIIMMILDKRKDLKTLSNLGLTTAKIRNIFFSLGMLLTLIGGTIGIAIGALLIWLQQSFSLAMITPSLAYPVELRLSNTLIVIVTIIVLGMIASKIASSRINKNLIA